MDSNPSLTSMRVQIPSSALLNIERVCLWNMSQYVITDGSRFIYRNYVGKYVPTSSEAMADIFSKKQANSVFANQLPKALKSVFYVERHDIPPEQVKQVTNEEIQQNIANTDVSENIQKWLDKISELNGLINDATKRKDELNQQLSDVDKELSDIMHYIEFCNLNASQGYKAYKMVKDRRIKRRSIKNELVVVDAILDKKISDQIVGEMKKIIHSLDNRTYTPRVLNELFDL